MLDTASHLPARVFAAPTHPLEEFLAPYPVDYAVFYDDGVVVAAAVAAALFVRVVISLVSLVRLVWRLCVVELSVSSSRPAPKKLNIEDNYITLQLYSISQIASKKIEKTNKQTETQ